MRLRFALQALKWLDQLASFECVKRVCRREPESDSPPPPSAGHPRKREGVEAEGQPGKKFQGGGDGGRAHVEEGGGRQQQKQHQGGKGGKPHVSDSGGADFTVHEYAERAGDGWRAGLAVSFLCVCVAVFMFGCVESA